MAIYEPATILFRWPGTWTCSAKSTAFLWKKANKRKLISFGGIAERPSRLTRLIGLLQGVFFKFDKRLKGLNYEYNFNYRLRKVCECPESG